MAPSDDTRARLEAQAAEILGRARTEAAEIARGAESEADDIRAEARRYAAERRLESEAAKEDARREVVRAQEQALAVRSEAQRSGDAIIRTATDRARAEADELLHDAQRRLASIIDETRDAESRVTATRTMLDAEVEALRRVSAMQSAFAEAEETGGPGPEVADRWTVDLTSHPFEEMVEAAVRAAVRRSVHPVDVRAGRYLIRGNLPTGQDAGRRS